MNEPDRVTPGPADWLSLAAAPTFALMALVSGALGGARPNEICGMSPSPMDGMVPMYLLMSVFHGAPWLRLIGRRRRRA